MGNEESNLQGGQPHLPGSPGQPTGMPIPGAPPPGMSMPPPGMGMGASTGMGMQQQQQLQQQQPLAGGLHPGVPPDYGVPSGGTTPMSDYMSVGTQRRRSSTSTIQLSPVEPPEPDLSHLSEEERAQIAAVIARAKEMQEEEGRRVR